MHWIARIQLISMIEEDLARIRRFEKPWIEYVWRGPEETHKEPAIDCEISGESEAQRAPERPY